MLIDPPAAASSSSRLPWIDAARGVALAAMVVYHFSWDLHYFGFLAADVEDALGWRLFARSIAGTFLFIVGVSLVLATRRGLDVRRYLRRLALIAASAAAITLVTWFLFPDAFIFFGVLHHIAVASVLGLLFVWAPVPVTIGAAVLSFAAPAFLSAPIFDHPALIWLGLSTAYPRSNDFVPLFPWFGVVLAGIAVARLWLQFGSERLAPSRAPNAPRALRWLGRHTLVIYLLHQPILFGLVDFAAWAHPPAPIEFGPWFAGVCNAQCVESEVDPAVCTRICACIAPKAEAAGLSDLLVLNRLSDAQTQQYSAIVDDCRAAEGE